MKRLLAAALLAASCGPAEPAPPPDIEVKGDWRTNFGGTLSITNALWQTQGAVAVYDNVGRWAVTQSPADDPYTPGKFAKQVWTQPAAGTWYWCTVEYGRDTLAEARDTTKIANATSPETGGCGSFPWTRMSPKPPDLEIAGSWKTNFGTTVAITNAAWETQGMISKYDNAARFALTKSPADDPYTPNQWAKQVWTAPAGEAWYWCTIAYGKDTEAAAEGATDVADATSPENGGCGAFTWTKMTRP